jgi:formylglycine-generating enzyme required for sulfatase activity
MRCVRLSAVHGGRIALLTMAGKVFISYRRDDSKYPALMIYTAFCQGLPRGQVFMDVDSIPPGANFRKILKDWVDQCEVLLALIGPGWIDANDPKTGRSRLENPSDFVRIEIGEALARDIPVVPVLLDRTPMPDVKRLPDDLKGLVDRQAELVEFPTFDDDVKRLIRRLQLALPPPPPGAIVVDVSRNGMSKTRAFVPGNGHAEWFTDHPQGQEMVVVPAGTFMMGSLKKEPDRHSSEGPQHKVTIAQPFAVGRPGITRGQFAAFVHNTNYRAVSTIDDRSWRNRGFAQDDNHPVVCVNWDEANAYATWLSNQTGKEYRLLREAEWEYVARAGTTTPFWWGSGITPSRANYDGNHVYKRGGSKGEYRKATVPVATFSANPWGLFNVHGNVWEWCEDAWHYTYSGAPSDGSAWLQGGDTTRRVVRGGSWSSIPHFLRSAYRHSFTTDDRGNGQGFRLARTLLS